MHTCWMRPKNMKFRYKKRVANQRYLSLTDQTLEEDVTVRLSIGYACPIRCVVDS